MIPYELNESREYRQRRGKSEARLQKSGAFNQEMNGYRLDAKVLFLSTRSKFPYRSFPRKAGWKANQDAGVRRHDDLHYS
jgi:hypothetical protein